jgi:hypothetical protein
MSAAAAFVFAIGSALPLLIASGNHSKASILASPVTVFCEVPVLSRWSKSSTPDGVTAVPATSTLIIGTPRMARLTGISLIANIY